MDDSPDVAFLKVMRASKFQCRNFRVVLVIWLLLSKERRLLFNQSKVMVMATKFLKVFQNNRLVAQTTVNLIVEKLQLTSPWLLF